MDLAIAYGLLAALACAFAWGGKMRMVGVILMGIWAASNLAQMYGPIVARDALNAFIDTFALTAFFMVAISGRAPGICYCMIALLTCSIAATVAHSFGAHNPNVLHSYEVALNVIFAVQCLLLGGAGMLDVVDRWQSRLLAGARAQWVVTHAASRAKLFEEMECEAWKE